MGYLTDINLLQQHITFPQPKPPAPELEEETAALAEVLPEREPSRLAARSHGTRSRNLEPPLPIHALRTETVRAPLPPAQPELNLQFEQRG